MTDKVLEAINTEINELTDRLRHLRSVRDTYNSPGKAERITGAEVADEITNWISKYNPDFVFTNAVACKGIGHDHAYQGIRVLLDRKIIRDTTPNKPRHKDYALTAKGKALLFPDTAKANNPRPVVEKRKQALKKAREAKEAKPAYTGTREKQLLEYLRGTQYFTREQAAKEMNYPSIGAAQVTMDKLNRKANGTLYKSHDKVGRVVTYRSLLFIGHAAYPSTTPPEKGEGKRENVIRPGEGVSTGRIRSF